MCKLPFSGIEDQVKLVDYSEIGDGYNISKFESYLEEYNTYIINDALGHQEKNVSHTHVLINKECCDIIAYVTLVTDSICLLPTEKEGDGLSDIPFSTLPALKIGKLAVNECYRSKYYGIGTKMVEIARAYAIEINNIGVACRYLTTDADVENNPSVFEFYQKCGFVSNQKFAGSKRKTVSMRKDIFYE